MQSAQNDYLAQPAWAIGLIPILAFPLDPTFETISATKEYARECVGAADKLFMFVDDQNTIEMTVYHPIDESGPTPKIRNIAYLLINGELWTTAEGETGDEAGDVAAAKAVHYNFAPGKSS
jgi:hypothetical protein